MLCTTPSPTAGWTGVVLMLLGCAVAGFNGVHLGHCWIMCLERYPDEYRSHVKVPYPSIGEKAYGKWMRYGVDTRATTPYHDHDQYRGY